MKQPIIEFENIEQACACLEEWKARLFLSDWIVKIVLCDADEMSLQDVSGECEWNYGCHSAVIRILKDPPKDRIIKVAHEVTLVHELLHMKIIYDMCDEDTIQGQYWRDQQHNLIDQIARSLIMAKYGVDFSWFRNF